MPDRSNAASTGQPTPGQAYEIPVEGSLALLALGARGIEAWRAKRAEVAAQAAASAPASEEDPTEADD